MKLNLIFLGLALWLLPAIGHAQQNLLTTTGNKPLLSTTGSVNLQVGTSPAVKWIACGQGMRWWAQGTQSGTARSSLTRMGHHCSNSFSVAKVVIPVATAISNSGTIQDQLFQGAEAQLNYQVGIAPTFTSALSGIPARTAFTFSGINYASYTYNGNNPGYIVSDAINVNSGSPITAGTEFDLWETVETPTSTTGNLPYVINCTNYIQRYVGNTSSTSSQIAALGGASDVALTATSISGVGAFVQGLGECVTPAFLLIQVPANTQSVALDGDSIGFGFNDGLQASWSGSTSYSLNDKVKNGFNLYIVTTAGTSNSSGGPTGTGTNISDGSVVWNYESGLANFGDAMGDQYGNSGWGERWADQVLNVDHFNIAVPSDQFHFRATSSNWTYRQQIIALAQPSGELQEMGINDVSSGSSPVTIEGYAATTYALTRAAVPAIHIVQSATMPHSSSTDNYRTTANQTPMTFFGNSSSNRGVWNDSYVRNPSGSGLSQYGWVDSNYALEYGYNGTSGSETSLWNVNGNINQYTVVSPHPTSYGFYQAQIGMRAYNSSGVQVTNPF